MGLPPSLGWLSAMATAVEQAGGVWHRGDTTLALRPSGLVPTSCVPEPVRLLVSPPSHPRHAHLGWPKIVRTPSGVLVLGCIAGPWHFSGGCPAVCRSTDGGRTFSALQVLATFDEATHYHHCGNIALGQAADGALVLLAMAFTDDVRNTILGWRSEDDGQTWVTVDASALADNRTGSVYGGMMTVPDLGLVVFGHYRGGSAPHSQGIWFAVSTDNGKAWGEPRLVTGSRLVEPAFTFAEGRFVGLIRNNPAVYYTQLVSADLGETWHETASPVGVGESGLPSPFVTVSQDDPARLLGLLTKRGARQELGYIELWTADAGTLDWRPARKLVSFPLLEGGMDARPMDEFRKAPYELPEGVAHAKTDFGYPWLAALGPGRWLMVFYCGKVAGWNGLYGCEFSLD